MRSRRADTGDGRAGQQLQLRARLVLLLALQRAAVLPLLHAAGGGRGRRGAHVRGRGGARAGLLRAVPGAGGGAPRRARAAAGRRRAAAAAGALTDRSSRVRAYSECARLEVIVLRFCASHPRVPRAPDYDPNFY